MPTIATIYEHSKYAGRALRLQGVGKYDYSTLYSHGFNDLTSSIRIERGYYMQAYADSGFRGASATFTGNTSYVGNGFNDKISSLRILKGTPSSNARDPITGHAETPLASPGGFSGPKKQAVWNKSGFVLDVAWLDPVTGRTVKEDEIWTGQGSYIIRGRLQKDPYDVRLSIVNKGLAEAGLAAGIVAPLALGAGFAAGASVAVSGMSGLTAGTKVLSSRPKHRTLDLFWSGTPSLDGRHLDVWGTVWNPQVGPGGPITIEPHELGLGLAL